MTCVNSQLSHISQAYSKIGRIYNKYSFSRLCLLNLYFNFRRIPKCLDTLKIIFSFYNIKNGHASNYLRELIPPTVQSTTVLPLKKRFGFNNTFL
jgi:hypothetical protein